MKQIDISKATSKDIENILIDVCKKSGIDTRLATVFISTGGLFYTFEKNVANLYLMPVISFDIHLLMRTINIGFDIQRHSSHLYELNDRLLRIEKNKLWELERETKEIEVFREQFLNKLKELKSQKIV